MRRTKAFQIGPSEPAPLVENPPVVVVVVGVEEGEVGLTDGDVVGRRVRVEFLCGGPQAG